MAFSDLVAAADRAGQQLLGGEDVTYAPAVGAPVTVTGIFDEQYVFASGGGANAGVETIGPAVSIRISDLGSVNPLTDDPTITIRGIDYSVWERKPDGMGLVVLALHVVT